MGEGAWGMPLPWWWVKATIGGVELCCVCYAGAFWIV